MITGIYHKVIGLGVVNGEISNTPFSVSLSPLKPISHNSNDANKNKGIIRTILLVKKSIILLPSLPKLYFFPNKYPDVKVNNPKHESQMM